MRRAQLGQAAGVVIGVASGAIALGFAVNGAGGEPEVPETGPLPVVTPDTPWESLPLAEVGGALDVRSWLGREPGRAIESCSGATGITALVFAYAPTEG